MQDKLTVIASPAPFSHRRVAIEVAYGKTVAQIVEQVIHHPIDVLDVSVTVGGAVIPQKLWHAIKPKMGNEIRIDVTPKGGRGGKKNILSTLISIGVMIAAPQLSVAALGKDLAATTIIGKFTVGKLFGAALGMVANLITSALAPPPRPASRDSGIAESPTQFITGARNQVNRYGVVPIYLGTNRVVPYQAALPYTETVNSEQYVRQLFTWGYGKVSISDLKIGETPISEFNDIEIEHFLEGNLSQGSSIFPNAVATDEYGVLLKQVDGYTTRTSRDDADEIIVDITFLRGLSIFTDEGARVANTVELECQYAPTGTSDWSTAATSFTAYSGATITPQPIPFANINSSGGIFGTRPTHAFRSNIVVIDKYSGVISALYGGNIVDTEILATAPITPQNSIRLATFVQRRPIAGGTTETFTLIDDRVSSLDVLQNTTDFAPSLSVNDVVIASGSIKFNNLRITASQAEPLRITTRFNLPSRGQYDVRIRRLSADTVNDRIFDEVTLTGIQSITKENPVSMQGISGTAVRIKATDQLNGALDDFNAICSSVCLDYDVATDTWIEAATSNPAALYRYVLQHPDANQEPKSDGEIDIAQLEAWYVYCDTNGYTYDRGIDYEASVDDVLRDISAAGRAAPTIIDGKQSVVIDNEKTIISGLITPANSWGFQSVIAVQKLPHALRVEFRNKDKGYNVDERIVYDDGFTSANATLFERMEYASCTNSGLAFKHGRAHLANATLQPETFSVMMDIENFVFNLGDRVKLQHDVALLGNGSGYIKAVTDNGINVTSITLDSEIDMATSGLGVRIRSDDGSTAFYNITNSSPSATLTFTTPIPLASAPAIGSLCIVSALSLEADMVIVRIERQQDLTAKIIMKDYAPARFNADKGTIPDYDSNITLPLSFRELNAPILVSMDGDESVFLRQSDGTYLSRLVIAIRNTNGEDIITTVMIRRTGDTVYRAASLYEASPNSVSITGLDDGARYDIAIRYKRGSKVSKPLLINNYRYAGATAKPSDVNNFLVTINGTTAIFRWDANPDIDISHYVMRFSRVFSGATWATAQTIATRINETQLTIPFIGGTYLIKAVDRLGNESLNATAIITYAESIGNVVETLTEAPTFAGSKDNVITLGSSIELADAELGSGYYYFTDTVDLGEVYESQVTSSILANGKFTNNLYAIDDVYDVEDMYGSGSPNLYIIPDVYSIDDLYGIDATAWEVSLEYRTTDDDTSGSPIWSAWTPLSVTSLAFRGIQFRIKLISYLSTISPQVTQLNVIIDMPDRRESAEDASVPIGGLTVTYSPAFAASPSVQITIQDGAVDDRIEFVSKSSTGFTFKVYNGTLAAYVARVCDYIIEGYGRVL